MAAKATRDVLRVTVRIPKELLKRVEDFQFSRRLNSRVEALLQLIEIGLEANSPISDPHFSPGPHRRADRRHVGTCLADRVGDGA